MTTRVYCALFAGLLLTGTVRAETLEEVEKKIIAASEKIKTMSAKSVSTTETEMASMTSKVKQEGTTETARRGEKVYVRAELKSVTLSKMGDEPEKKTESKVLSIMDGEFLYTVNDEDGKKSAMKMKLPEKTNAPVKDMFTELHKDNELKLLPEEKVDGKAAYVIELTPKKPAPETTTSIKMYYRQDDGAMVKSVTSMKSAQMKMTSTSVMSDIKINPDIKPERFVFKAPEGVEVQDMTKLQEAQATEAKPADEKPAEEPKEEAKEVKKPEEKQADPPPAKKESKKPKLPRLPGLK